MDLLTFASNLIDSLAWPIVLVIVIFILKKPISNLINRITKITKNDTSVEFSKDVIRLNRKVDKIIDSEQTLDLIVGENQVDKYYDEAYLDSRTAIINGWLLIEESLRDLAKRKELLLKHYEPSGKILSILRNKGILPINLYETIDEARRLRNEAVHSPDFSISPDDAQNYVSMAFKISEFLRSEIR